jgi:hypothetical protein
MLDIAIAEAEGTAGHVDCVGTVPGVVHDSGGVVADGAKEVADFVCHCETQKEIGIDTQLFGEPLNARPDDSGIVAVRGTQGVSDGVGIALGIERSILAYDAELERPAIDGASLGRQRILGVRAEPPMCWDTGPFEDLLCLDNRALDGWFGCTDPVMNMDMRYTAITNCSKTHHGQYL